MKLFKGLCIFAAGALAGAAVAARVVRDKYQQEAEEEIAEMRDYYRELRKENVEKYPVQNEEAEAEKEENTKDEYNKIVKDYTNYTQYNDTETKENKKEVKEERTNYEPFIIDVEEFGEDPTYDTATLTYYKDKVLTNDLDDVIDYSVAGEENLKIFDEHPDCKAIYVRDDIYMVDYEIIRDPYQYDEYDDFPDKKPHQL
jgi:gas vesicle protein